ncbi:hypothetical protein HCH_05420 [Hahella chejuensis KCTC 2396]|uniref:Uncharacterized protein n=1 Tax=Hahella chejuensis (strain KCTC 2396) TaxID=349521 RepID=Q2SB86_HAHCH|nr:hypothetical protein [Hahella chejuensis]ABC32088.1 hypothetical protein HCH_05420 [Hahella chejuensis KCTC 2396]
MALPERVAKWHIKLDDDQMTVAEAFASIQSIALKQEDIPLIIQLVENPKFDIPGINLFNGATGLKAHDYIHVLLGRGVAPKDEAFVLGFTMGSTNRVTTTEERLYSFFAKYLYPKVYQMNDEDLQVFKDAVRLGYVSDCTPLDTVDFEQYSNHSLKDAREAIGLEVDLLKAYFAIEKKRYPDSRESQRNL